MFAALDTVRYSFGREGGYWDSSGKINERILSISVLYAESVRQLRIEDIKFRFGYVRSNYVQNNNVFIRTSDGIRYCFK